MNVNAEAGAQQTAGSVDFREFDAAVIEATTSATIGELPPQPHTLRGVIGGLLVKVVQRMLFWYTPGISRFHQAVVGALVQSRAALGLLQEDLRQARVGAPLIHDLLERNRFDRMRHAETEAENANRAEALQKQVWERLDRIESEVSKVSVRADILMKLNLGLEEVRAQLDERATTPSGPDLTASVAALQARVQENHQTTVELRDDVQQRIRTQDEALTALGSNIQSAMNEMRTLEQLVPSLRQDFEWYVSKHAESHTGQDLATLRRIEDEAQKTAQLRRYFEEFRLDLQTRIQSEAARCERNHLAEATQLEDFGRRLSKQDVATEALELAFNRRIKAESDERGRSVATIQERVDLLTGRLTEQRERTEHTWGEVDRRLSAQIVARESFEATASRRFGDLQQIIDQTAAQVKQMPSSLEQSLADGRATMEEATRQLAATSGRMERAEALAKESYIFSHSVKKDLTLLDLRYASLRAIKSGKSVEAIRNKLIDPFDSRDDALYVAFEDIFRGSREDIKDRQKIYLERIAARPEGRRVVDLGCGRGEWIELLRDHEIPAIGIDRNASMIETCKQLGLEVQLEDALDYLRKLPNGSTGVISSFHMVEHLPFSVVQELLAEALRALASGGVLILETPNPDNLLVSARTFYTDPTHLRPLPSSLLKFVVEYKGFCFPDVINLHPYPNAYRFVEENSEVGRRLNEYFYGPQDYGVVAIKP